MLSSCQSAQLWSIWAGRWQRLTSQSWRFEKCQHQQLTVPESVCWGALSVGAYSDRSNQDHARKWAAGPHVMSHTHLMSPEDTGRDAMKSFFYLHREWLFPDSLSSYRHLLYWNVCIHRHSQRPLSPILNVTSRGRRSDRSQAQQGTVVPKYPKYMKLQNHQTQWYMCIYSICIIYIFLNSFCCFYPWEIRILNSSF